MADLTDADLAKALMEQIRLTRAAPAGNLARDAGFYDIGRGRYGESTTEDRPPYTTADEIQHFKDIFRGVSSAADPEIFSQAVRGMPKSRNVQILEPAPNRIEAAFGVLKGAK